MSRSFWKRLAGMVGVGVYLIGVLMLTVHYGFPYRTAAEVARQQLEAVTPLKIRLGDVRPGTPFNLRLTRVALGVVTPAGPMDVIDFDEVRLRFSPLAVLAGRLSVDLQARSGRGRIAARLDYRLGGHRDLTLSVDDMDLPDFALNQPAGKGRIAGRLTGRMTVLGRDNVAPTGGQGAVVIGPGRIDDIHVAPAPITSLEFERLAVDFKLQRNQVLIEKLQVDSPQGSLTVTGTVSDFQRLRLNLTGSAQMGSPGQPLASAEFRVGGTADKPAVKIMGMKGPGNLALPPLGTQ